jgi:hypothetical protein
MPPMNGIETSIKNGKVCIASATCQRNEGEKEKKIHTRMIYQTVYSANSTFKRIDGKLLIDWIVFRE